MARLRFPGRPGCRFDRNLVKHVGDGSSLNLEFESKLIANIQNGLQRFNELFGEDVSYFYRLL